MCVCVCVSARISPEPHARSLPIFVDVTYGHSSVHFQRGDEIPRGRGNLGFFPPLSDNTLYSIAFGTQVLDESIIGQEVGGALAHRGRSLIFMIALFISVFIKNKCKNGSLYTLLTATDRKPQKS